MLDALTQIGDLVTDVVDAPAWPLSDHDLVAWSCNRHAAHTAEQVPSACLTAISDLDADTRRQSPIAGLMMSA